MNSKWYLAIIACLALCIALLLRNQAHISNDVALLRNEVLTNKRTLELLVQSRSFAPQATRTSEAAKPEEQPPRSASQSKAPQDTPADVLNGWNSLIQERNRMQNELNKLGEKVFSLAREFDLTQEILDNPDQAPEQFRPFFAAYRNWKNHVRILQTMDMRLQAEGEELRAVGISPPEFQAGRPGQ